MRGDDERALEGTYLRAWQDAGDAARSLGDAIRVELEPLVWTLLESPRRLAAFLTGTSPAAEVAMRRVARSAFPDARPDRREVLVAFTASVEPLRRAFAEAGRAMARLGERLQAAGVYAAFDCSAFSVAVARRAEYEVRRARWHAWRRDVQSRIDARPRDAVGVLMREVAIRRRLEANTAAIAANTAALRRGLR